MKNTKLYQSILECTCNFSDVSVEDLYDELLDNGYSKDDRLDLIYTGCKTNEEFADWAIDLMDINLNKFGVDIDCYIDKDRMGADMLINIEYVVLDNDVIVTIY